MENDLENTLQKLQLGQENNIEELNRVRTKKLREDTFRGIIMRTKAKWNVEGERSSKYFCNLEKRHFGEKAIPKLILDNGFEITNQDDILTQHIFYEALYTSKGTVVRDRPFNLKGGYGFLVRSEFFFRTRVRKLIFFPEFNIGLYDKNSESDYFLFLHQNQNIFFSNIGNFFFQKKTIPPSSPLPAS